jgi:LysM repeat protein
VQGGDTLSAIATKNNSSVDAIVAANNLPNRNVTLNIGQKLVIP